MIANLINRMQNVLQNNNFVYRADVHETLYSDSS
jgi:hypothetical protein